MPANSLRKLLSKNQMDSKELDTALEIMRAISSNFDDLVEWNTDHRCFSTDKFKYLWDNLSYKDKDNCYKIYKDTYMDFDK
jgi:hypothetical protein